MTQRMNIEHVAPQAFRAMMSMQKYVSSTRIEQSLLHLVYLRASYMNGCAYCVDMHTKDARAAGEIEQRLYAVPVWRDTPFFSERERAAFSFTEAVTEIGRAGVPGAVYANAREYFEEAELVDLMMAVITINGWNRLTISFLRDVGEYQPTARDAA